MKKFKLKGLKLTSPRKEPKDERPPQSPISIDSQDDSYCTPDVKPEDEHNPPKRHSLFSTLRRKLNSVRRGGEHRRTRNWHDVHAGSSTSTLPHAKVSSWKAAPRHIQKPLRPSVSEERLLDSDSPEFLRKAKLSRNGQGVYRERFLKQEFSHSSKSEDESEKEESQHDQGAKELLPMDAEYGHASAPSSNEQSGAIPTSSSCESDTVQQCAAVTHTEEGTQTEDNVCRSSQPDQQIQSIHDAEHSCPLQSHSQRPMDPVRASKPWSLTDELFRLSKFGWYWGPITRVEAEEKLSSQPDGAFLVRDSSDERYLLSLSFRSYGRTLHTRIEHCNGVFSFYAQPECEGYKSVVSLIHHSMTDSQTGVFCYSRARTPGAPSFPVRLTKPVSRFTHVRSLQYLCRFVIRQNTRYDHIQKLPLPTSIKGWLEQNQY